MNSLSAAEDRTNATSDELLEIELLIARRADTLTKTLTRNAAEDLLIWERAEAEIIGTPAAPR